MGIRKRPIARQLEAYEEGWKKDHEQAMHCMDFEENLAVGTSIFRTLVQLDVLRRQRVSLGAVVFNVEEDDATMLDAFRWWLRSRDEALTRLRRFEDRFGAVEGGPEFRRCCEEAQEIVSEWKPALPKPGQNSAQEAVVAHTDKVRAPAEMSRALDQVSRPTESESLPLGFNPDDYPLF